MTVYIKDWQRVFGLREAAKHDEVTWTKFPVARGGLTYRRLMATAKGRTAYCVFIGCLRIAARERTNGALVFRGRDVTVQDLNDETGIPKADCAAGFAYLQTAEVGWLTGSETVSRRFETGGEPVCGRRETAPRQEVEKEEEKKKDIPPAAAPAKAKDKKPEAPPDNTHAEWVAHFSTEWAAHHFGAEYVFAGAKDGAAVKAIRKALKDDFALFRFVVSRYLGDNDRFIVDNHGHSLSFLATRLNVYKAKYTVRVTATGTGTDNFTRIEF